MQAVTSLEGDKLTILSGDIRRELLFTDTGLDMVRAFVSR